MSSNRSILLVVPGAEDDAGGRRSLALAEALAAVDGNDLRVLLWTSGALGAAWGALAPTVDAGEVNRWGPARMLTRARLGPVARLLKNRRLRARLAPFRSTSVVIVAGLAGLPALAWLPTRPGRIAIVLRPSDLPSAPPDPATLAALQEADLLVATTPSVERWLRDVGHAPPERIRRLALLDGPETAAAPRADEPTVGLVGWQADEVSQIINSLAGDSFATTFSWFVDEAEAWGLWQGPTATPLARHVRLASPIPRTDALFDLAILAVGADGPEESDLVAAAEIFATTVIRCGPRGVDAAVRGVHAGRDAVPPVSAPWIVSLAAGAQALSDEGDEGDEGDEPGSPTPPT